MDHYRLPVCFWCGKGLQNPPCAMSNELGEGHAKQQYFLSDLPKERLPRGAKILKTDEDMLAYKTAMLI